MNYLTRVAFGMVWRYVIFAAIFIASFGAALPDTAHTAAVVWAGIPATVRGWRIVRVWHIVMVGGIVGWIAPGWPIYPYVLTLALAWLTLAPWWYARRPNAYRKSL